ncbi:hypothetical protein AWC02_18450 [Mycolicibacter engbaekii]|uniref:PE-PPE domain-containing protein n=1 Tax=Mycolicibacter engbaekii TaxID=188915 RepID=A0A1X1T745_9MYCO|nr:hypothetical protein [Mycolicibacter engbaekii]ORV40360.1 hypothetical protein AWC02_18450 [Mycolicibacter engbaekii]
MVATGAAAPPRRYATATASAALAASTAVAVVAPVSPAAPWIPGLTAAERAVQLTADPSFLNIPFNFFQDLVNIPFNNVQSTNVLSNSFFFTGNWFTPSATNLWGEDPGDPGHFMAIVNYLFPFAPEISGLYQPEIDPDALANGTAGLGQQLAMFAAAMLPVSASCDAIQCYPMSPVEPITGLTGLDRAINFLVAFSNFPNDDNQLDLFKYWLKVPLQDLVNGYTFPSSPFSDPDNPTSAGIASPVEGIGPNGSVPGGFGFPGTHPLLDDNGDPVLDEYGNQINLMPWAGVTFKFDLFGPILQWFNSLMQPVDWSVNGADPTVGFHFASADEVAQAMKALIAGLVIDFNPYVAGSPLCPGLCNMAPFSPPWGVTTLDLVKSIQAIGAPNPQIQQWIDLTEAAGAQNAVGDANGSTDEQIVAAISALQTGTFTFDTETHNAIIDFLGDINPYLPNLAVNSGLLTDPGFLGPWPINPETGYYMPPTWNPDLPLDEQQIGEYGGLNSLLVWDDFLRVLDPSGGLVADLDALWAEIASWFTF